MIPHAQPFPDRAEIAHRAAVPLLGGVLIAFVALLAMIEAPPSQANSCIAVPPARIAGAFCGRVIDQAGGIETDGELRLIDKDGTVISRASVNSKGDFKFPPLPKGSYRVTTTAAGFKEYVGEVEILKESQTSCKKPAVVVLGLMTCTGGIDAKHKPPHFREPGW